MESLRTRIESHDLGEPIIQQMPEDPASLLPKAPNAISQVTGVVSRTFSAL